MNTHIFNLKNICFCDKKFYNSIESKPDFEKIKRIIIDILRENGECSIGMIIDILNKNYNLNTDRSQASNLIYKLKKQGKIKSFNVGDGNKSIRYHV